MTELTPQQISVSFVTQYYFILSSNTKNLYKFYKNESEMTHEHSTVVKQLPGNINPNAAVGAEIEKKIPTLGYEECKVKLTYVDSQRSLNGAVFVFVEGVMTRQVDQKEMNFTQTFLLAEQENGYYVRNDYLRFIPDASSIPTAQASASQNTPVAESSTTASVSSTTSSSEHHSKSQNGHQLSFSLNSSTVNIVSTTNGSHSPRSEASSTAATAGASSVYGGAAEEENQLEDEAEEEEIKVPEKKPQTHQPTQAKSTTSVPAESKEPHGTISYAAAASGRDFKNETTEQQQTQPKHKSGKKHNKENKEHKTEQHKTEKTENKEHKTEQQHKEHKEHKEHKTEHHKNDHKKPASAPTGEQKPATTEKKEKTFRGKDHPLNKHAIYVRDLPVGTKDSDLKDAFATYGSIIDINNKSGKDQSYNKYALIFFEKQQSVDEVLKNPSVKINDHQCPITKYQRKPKQYQRTPNQPTTATTPKTETTTPTTTSNAQPPRNNSSNRAPRQKYARTTSNEGESEKK